MHYKCTAACLIYDEEALMVGLQGLTPEFRKPLIERVSSRPTVAKSNLVSSELKATF